MPAEPTGRVPTLTFAKLAGLPGLTYAISLRPADMSYPGDPPARHDRRRLCEQLHLDPGRLTLPQQVHGRRIAVVCPQDAGAGRGQRENAIPRTDGLVCTLPGVPIMVLSADCALVLVYDPARRAVGLAHAGWKGTIAGITRGLVSAMIEQAGCRPDDLWAGISPAAGPTRYQVGPEVRQQAVEAMPDADRYFPAIAGGMVFDLWACNRDQLLDAGVPAEQIDLAGLCTIGDERFFSYRRDGAGTGRFGLLAAITQ
jgi:YfiH family protein